MWILQACLDADPCLDAWMLTHTWWGVLQTCGGRRAPELLQVRCVLCSLGSCSCTAVCCAPLCSLVLPCAPLCCAPLAPAPLCGAHKSNTRNSFAPWLSHGGGRWKRISKGQTRGPTGVLYAKLHQAACLLPRGSPFPVPCVTCALLRRMRRVWREVPLSLHTS
jgi:hypothetical protein